MPSIASHMVCAKLVSEMLNIKDDDFYRGNILPDIIDKEDSHKKIQSSFYQIPDISRFKVNNILDLGYKCHLLLDKYFLEEYIPNNIKNYKKEMIFTKEKLYNDYTNINYYLIDRYQIDIDYLNRIFKDFSCELNISKYEYNMKCLNSKVIDDLRYLDKEKFSDFLLNISIRIRKEVEYEFKLIMYNACT